MKQKYRIGDVLYYHRYIFVIKRISGDSLEYDYRMYRIESTGLSMWVSEIEIYNRCKLIEI